MSPGSGPRRLPECLVVVRYGCAARPDVGVEAGRLVLMPFTPRRSVPGSYLKGGLVGSGFCSTRFVVQAMSQTSCLRPWT